MRKRFHLPSPAMVLATIALFVALTGTAVAAGIVAKAKFALNAGKLQGSTAAQVAAMPGPASTAAGLVSTKSASFSLPYLQRPGGERVRPDGSCAGELRRIYTAADADAARQVLDELAAAWAGSKTRTAALAVWERAWDRVILWVPGTGFVLIGAN